MWLNLQLYNDKKEQFITALLTIVLYYFYLMEAVL